MRCKYSQGGPTRFRWGFRCSFAWFRRGVRQPIATNWVVRYGRMAAWDIAISATAGARQEAQMKRTVNTRFPRDAQAGQQAQTLIWRRRRKPLGALLVGILLLLAPALALFNVSAATS